MSVRCLRRESGYARAVRLHAARLIDRSGHSDADIASWCGMSRVSLALRLAGVVTFSVADISRLAVALNVPVSALTGPPTNPRE